VSQPDAVRPYFAEGEEAFTALVLRYLDGLTRDEEAARLGEALRAGAPCRDLFVAACQLHGEMVEVHGPIRLAVTPKKSASWRSEAPAAGRARRAAGGGTTAARAPGALQAVREPPGPHPEAAKEGGEEARRTKLTAEDTVYLDRKAKDPPPPPP
jgi:hypothetical protein